MVKVESLRTLLKILGTKLNGGNLIKGIKTWAVAFIDWNCAELTQLD